MRLSPDTLQRIRALSLVVLPFIGFVIAVVLLWNRYVFWHDMVLLGVMYFVTTIGVTLGFHRMITHEGFQTPGWLRGLILICGTMAVEGSVMDWVATHVKHHAHSDEEDDPHSPLHGFWHAHMGWIFARDSFADPHEYAPRLFEDPVIVFVQRTTALWMALALVIPFAIGGWTGLIWAGAVRIFLTTHITWSVNSICHSFGRRAFETTDESRNEWIVGLLGMGEGWHNNHHAFPRNAFHGLRWWQFDMTGLTVRAMEALGLAWDVQRVSAETIQAHRTRTVTMVESLQELRLQVLQSVAGARDELESLISSAVADSLSAEEYRKLQAIQEETLSRLGAIQSMLSRATHTKRPRLLQYVHEVQEAVRRVRQAVSQRTTMTVH